MENCYRGTNNPMNYGSSRREKREKKGKRKKILWVFSFFSLFMLFFFFKLPYAEALKESTFKAAPTSIESAFTKVGVVGPSFNLDESDRFIEEKRMGLNGESQSQNHSQMQSRNNEKRSIKKVLRIDLKKFFKLQDKIKQVNARIKSQRAFWGYKHKNKNILISFPKWKGSDGIIDGDKTLFLRQGLEVMEGDENLMTTRKRVGKTVVVEEGLLEHYEEFTSLFDAEEEKFSESRNDLHIEEGFINAGIKPPLENNNDDHGIGNTNETRGENIVTFQTILLQSTNFFKKMQHLRRKCSHEGYLKRNKDEPLARFRTRAQLPYHPPHLEKNIDSVISTVYRKMVLSNQIIDRENELEELLDQRQESQERQEKIQQQQHQQDENMTSSTSSLASKSNGNGLHDQVEKSKEYIYLTVPTRYDKAIHNSILDESAVNNFQLYNSRFQQYLTDGEGQSHKEIKNNKSEPGEKRVCIQRRPRSRPRPFVTISYAQSLDGSLAAASKDKVAISGKHSSILTHAIRSMHDCILVGAETAILDNPQLNVRLLENCQQLDKHQIRRIRFNREQKKLLEKSKNQKVKSQGRKKEKDNCDYNAMNDNNNNDDNQHLQNNDNNNSNFDTEKVFPCPRPVVLTSRLHRFYKPDIVASQKMSNPLIFTCEDSLLLDLFCQADLTLRTILSQVDFSMKTKGKRLTRKLAAYSSMTSFPWTEFGIFPFPTKKVIRDLLMPVYNTHIESDVEKTMSNTNKEYRNKQEQGQKVSLPSLYYSRSRFSKEREDAIEKGREEEGGREQERELGPRRKQKRGRRGEKKKSKSSVQQVLMIPRIKRYAISNIQTSHCGKYSSTPHHDDNSNYMRPSLASFNAIYSFKEKLATLSLPFYWSPSSSLDYVREISSSITKGLSTRSGRPTRFLSPSLSQTNQQVVYGGSSSDERKLRGYYSQLTTDWKEKGKTFSFSNPISKRKSLQKSLTSSLAFGLAKLEENKRSFLSIWRASNGKKLLKEAGFEVIICPSSSSSSKQNQQNRQKENQNQQANALDNYNDNRSRSPRRSSSFSSLPHFFQNVRETFRLKRRKNNKQRKCDLEFCLEQLYLKGYRSLMVEGGAEIIQAFLDEGLVDMLVVTIAPIYIGGYRLFPNNKNDINNKKNTMASDSTKSTMNSTYTEYNKNQCNNENNHNTNIRMDRLRIQNVQTTQLGDDIIIYGDFDSQLSGNTKEEVQL